MVEWETIGVVNVDEQNIGVFIHWAKDTVISPALEEFVEAVFGRNIDNIGNPLVVRVFVFLKVQYVHQ